MGVRMAAAAAAEEEERAVHQAAAMAKRQATTSSLREQRLQRRWVQVRDWTQSQYCEPSAAQETSRAAQASRHVVARTAREGLFPGVVVAAPDVDFAAPGQALAPLVWGRKGLDFAAPGQALAPLAWERKGPPPSPRASAPAWAELQ